jgi:hypothetical protein
MKRVLLFALAVAGMAFGTRAVRQDGVPEHLRGRPFDLNMRRGDRIVRAPEELLRLAREYPALAAKGPIVNGRRITLMTERDHYEIGEEVRVIHVLEALGPETSVYAMGPKPVCDEYVDGVRRTPPAPDGGSYDGVVLGSPAVDFNYDITSYVFHSRGVHTIEWRGGGASIEGLRGLHSNVVTISVAPRVERRRRDHPSASFN